MAHNVKEFNAWQLGREEGSKVRQLIAQAVDAQFKLGNFSTSSAMLLLLLEANRIADEASEEFFKN